jgi:hypothetical protein
MRSSPRWSPDFFQKPSSNLGAAAVELASDDLREIEGAASKIIVQGARYPEHLKKRTGR